MKPPPGISEREQKAWRMGFAEGLAHEQAKCKCRVCGRPRYWDDAPCEKCKPAPERVGRDDHPPADYDQNQREAEECGADNFKHSAACEFTASRGTVECICAPEARKPSHPETGATMTTPKQDSQMQAPDPSCAVGAAAPERSKP